MIRSKTETFIANLTVLIKRAALESVSAALGGAAVAAVAAPAPVAAKRGRGRPKKVATPAPVAKAAPATPATKAPVAAKATKAAPAAKVAPAAKAPVSKKAAAFGEKRPEAELAKLTEKLGEYIQTHPGLRIEPIGKALSTPTKELSLPIEEKNFLADEGNPERGAEEGHGVFRCVAAACSARRVRVDVDARSLPEVLSRRRVYPPAVLARHLNRTPDSTAAGSSPRLRFRLQMPAFLALRRAHRRPAARGRASRSPPIPNERGTLPWWPSPSTSPASASRAGPRVRAGARPCGSISSSRAMQPRPLAFSSISWDSPPAW